MSYSFDIILDSWKRDLENWSQFLFLIFVTQGYSSKHEKEKGKMIIKKVHATILRVAEFYYFLKSMKRCT